jgi:hypothetical protein
MSRIEPEKIEIERLKVETETTETRNETGTTVKRRWKFSAEAEDLVALFGGVIAVICAIAMAFGAMPVNKLTVGIVTFSGVGAAIAGIVKAKKGKKKAR